MIRCYKFISIAIIIVGCVLLVDSCTKKAPKCRYGCLPAIISGRIYDKTNGAPFRNVPVTVTWIKRAYCIGCTMYKVASGNSGPDGSFLFNVTLDTSAFKNYFLRISLPGDSSYFSNFTTFPGQIISYVIDKPDPALMQNIPFEFYPATSLTIRLHRVQNDTWQYFDVDHSFKGQLGGFGDCVIYTQQNARDSVLVGPTSADVYTKINWHKRTAGILIEGHSDSIICTKQGPNTYDIDY